MTEILLTGLKIGESARWHDDRLWLSNWGAGQILAVDLDGNAEVMATVPTTMPFSIDWLPDGRLLVVSGPEGRLLRQDPTAPWSTTPIWAGWPRTSTRSSWTAAATST
jgi:sugar lactone lactonase YvrE